MYVCDKGPGISVLTVGPEGSLGKMLEAHDADAEKCLAGAMRWSARVLVGHVADRPMYDARRAAIIASYVIPVLVLLLLGTDEGGQRSRAWARRALYRLRAADRPSTFDHLELAIGSVLV